MAFILKSVTPGNGPVSGGTRVTLDGKDFPPNLLIKFGGAAAQINIVTPTQIVVISPPHEKGVVGIEITDQATGAQSNSYRFSYGDQPLAYALDKLDPATGPAAGNTQVVLQGATFPPNVEVRFGGTAAVTNVVTPTQMIVFTPAHAAGPVNVEIVDRATGQSQDCGKIFRYVAQAVVTGVTPAMGPAAGNTEVVIEGTDLPAPSSAAGLEVTFDGAQATVLEFSATRIKVRIPPHAAGKVAIQIVDKTYNDSWQYLDLFAYSDGPMITGVAPDHGPLDGHIEVIVKGFNLAGCGAVWIGGASATIIGNTGNEIKVEIGPHSTPGIYPIKLVEPDPPYNKKSFADLFTYDPPPAPAAVDPPAGAAGAANPVTIRGTDFPPDVEVYFGGVDPANMATDVVRVNDTTITAKTPAGLPGKVAVYVLNATYGAGAGGADLYEFIVAPRITAIRPALGPVAGGTPITISGDHFDVAAAVTIGGVAALHVQVHDEQTITCHTPGGPAGAAALQVAVQGVSGDGAFAYVDRMMVTHVEPPSGPVAGGGDILIKGGGFPANAQVTIGGTLAAAVTLVGTSLKATIPPGLAGPVDIVVKDPATGTAVTLARSEPGAFVYVGGPAIAATGQNEAMFLMDGEEFFSAFQQLMDHMTTLPPHKLTYVRMAYWKLNKNVTLGDRTQWMDSNHTLLKYIKRVLLAGHNVDIIAWYGNWKARKTGLGKSVADQNRGFAEEVQAVDEYVKLRRARARIYLERYEGRVSSNHQKFVIFSVQGQRTVLLGGLNLSPEYFDDTTHQFLPHATRFKRHGWHDTAVLLRGPVTDDVEKEWTRRWQRAVDIQSSWFTLNNLQNQVRARYTAVSAGDGRSTIRRRAVAIEANDTPQQTYDPGVQVQIATTRSSGGQRYRDLRDLLLDRIGSAQNYVYMENNQITDPEIVRALYTRLKQVPSLRIRIVTNTNGGAAGFLTRRAWLHLVLRMRPPFLRRVYYKSEREKGVVRQVDRAGAAVWEVHDRYGEKGEGLFLENDALEIPNAAGTGTKTIKFQRITQVDCDFHFYYPQMSVADPADPARLKSAVPTVHSKLAIVDDRFTIIGSANWTYRSMQYDGEIAAFIENRTFATQTMKQLLSHYETHRLAGRPTRTPLKLTNSDDNFEAVAVANRHAELNSPDELKDRTALLPLEYEDHGGLEKDTPSILDDLPGYVWL